MDFFQAQSRARTNTFWLVLLFCFTVFLLISGMYAAIHFSLVYTDFTIDNVPIQKTEINYKLFFYISSIILIIVLAGSFYRAITLSNSGVTIADAMGGKPVFLDTKKPQERQLLNIVEEMSIASGCPMPQVFIIPEQGINAFAAGNSINNAVIGVTKGALNAFSREEMQGVIAHEFSHILNGDMRLNIRIISIISGITLLGTLGYYLIYFGSSISRSMSSRRNDQLTTFFPIFCYVGGTAAIIIGFCGTITGSIIRASISRQREFLADASAVQFTRNPNGIASALEKIHLLYTAKLLNKNVSEFSHLFFADGIVSRISNPFASHPPLEKRIKKVLPHWDKTTPINKPITPPPAESPKPKNIMKENILAHIGLLSQAAISTAATINKVIPKNLVNASENPYSARALIYSMVIDKKNLDYRQKQIDYLMQHADDGIHKFTLKLLPDILNLSHREVLSLVQKTIPTLRLLSHSQYEKFLNNLSTLVIIDNKIEIFEWCLSAVVSHTLFDCFNAKEKIPKATPMDYAYALSSLAHCSGHDTSGAFAAATKNLPFSLTLADNATFCPQQLFNAMQKLSRLNPKQKKLFVDACITCVLHHKPIKKDEETILRTYLIMLDCPSPVTLDH